MDTSPQVPLFYGQAVVLVEEEEKELRPLLCPLLNKVNIKLPYKGIKIALTSTKA